MQRQRRIQNPVKYLRWMVLTIFEKYSIFDVLQGSKYNFKLIGVAFARHVKTSDN